MEKDIITAIRAIRSNTSFVTTKSKERKPILRDIYDYLKESQQLICENEYQEMIQNLEDQGIIYKREGKSYYHVRDDYQDEGKYSVISNNSIEKITDDNIDDTVTKMPSDRNLIDMIKESVYEEKIRNSELIEYLKGQIKFFQDELRQKNIVINKLLEKEALVEIIETRRERGSATNTKSNIKHQIQNSGKKVNEPIINQKIITENKRNSNCDNKPNDNYTPSIEIIGDSHLNAINPKGLSKKNNITVRNHPGSTTEDLKSFIIPSIKKKRDVIVIRSGTNDLTKGINTIDNLNWIVNRIRKNSAHTKIVISSLLTRKDIKELDKKVKDMNVQLKAFCDENIIEYLCNDNIDESNLGVKKLHLSKKGSGNFARNFIECMRKFY